MVRDFPADAVWRKSSHSGSGNDTCVEVSASVAGVVGVRDSVDPGGLVLAFAPSAWRAFTARVKDGELAL
ncbi:DUF397 domain-containing protein [Actinomadura sp. LD22]|uniref:DUF397 domain-containing protein n=1 Tax=Actinomadura physcomitrii TaxID=2650748 RepID=A0A6I4M7A3_9ACTN|nr:DUF397 domain-containing protein [Actinomadura physcomitrii]MWA01482.1 DUF397 domain-containing protein [Actinomadura physcomitrii]